MFALQSTGFGPRAPLLAEQVRRYPGSIDVYRLRDTVGGFHRDGSIREMMHIIRHQYGWLSLAKISMIHLAGIRWLARASENDREESMYPPFCSEAIARSYRIGGGIDLVPNLADAYTEPGDLARSGKLRFVGTIVKD
ncbi:hypothetical protein [Trichococcus shcherbakoviae]|uniref:hypothetical protein n=1 Tax=Trichococcus shcherbakoviae TaxID=2094020 RepID=UPI002AA64128|nr:hypothetical protein [Trichococcus shcherbakoviae]